MIVVWNTTTDAWYGFTSIEHYRAFARRAEGQGRSALDDILWDVGDNGGEVTDENQIRDQQSWLGALEK